MHIYFIGIGGTGVGPLALIARQAGYEVSGSDYKSSEYTRYLENKDIDIAIDQSGHNIAIVHQQNPIDWVVSVSAIIRNNPEHPELAFAQSTGIRITERDSCLNEILSNNGLKMIAAAGTHGKTTTAAMLVWMFKNLGIPISYSVGAKMPFADMGHFEPSSKYFVYECDEFHRNFLHFAPYISVISGIAWDHHEVYPTVDSYNQAFLDFINQSENAFIWRDDAKKIGLKPNQQVTCFNKGDKSIHSTKLPGRYNRENAWLVLQAVRRLSDTSTEKLRSIINKFPGVQRRMEELSINLFTDYAHTPEKIRGCLSVAKEIAQNRGKKIVVVYEPLTDRRQHYIKEQYRDCFEDVDILHWVPSYLSRENPKQKILSPADLILYLNNPEIAKTSELNDDLWDQILSYLASDYLVVCISGGGGDSLDEWLRVRVRALNQ